MRKITLIVAAVALISNVAAAQDKANIKWYGFIRNYFAYDSRECKAGTADMFLYLPLDEKKVNNIDTNANPNFTFTSITSRLGVDVSGYEFEGLKIGAKIEADFYAGLSGVTGTATFRLRQAYLTATRNDATYKIGQAWHPMAADFPDVFSLNTGSPFGPFNRSPLVQFDYKINKNLGLAAAAIWQMQYVSAGPDGASANYMKYSMTPELFLGLNWKNGGFSSKLGVNMLSISPRTRLDDGTPANERITTFGAFAYLAYSEGDFSVKAKSYLGEGGEHMNLNSGYAVAADITSRINYTPYRNSSSWISFKYGKKVQGVLFAGYVKNFGTRDEIRDKSSIYFSKNSFVNMNQMYRITPAILYNMGKLQFGLEYELTSVQYGSWDDVAMTDWLASHLISSPGTVEMPAVVNAQRHGLATKDLHWVSNHRIQAMVKYTF